MDKEIVIILSHADTTDKLEILDKCISEMKKQGYDIIISSHIEVPEKYHGIVDYIVYDMDNPMIRYGDIPGAPHVFLWHTTHAYSQRYPLEYNHSYAVMKLIKTALGVAYANGYEKAHFVNYDYVIKNPDVLKTHSVALESNDIHSYYWDSFETTRRHLNTGLFSVKVKPFLEVSNKINSTNDFLNEGIAVFENFVFEYYVERNGLSLSHVEQDSIIEGNIINSKSTLKNVIDDRISAYLAKEENTGEYFISLRIGDGGTEDIIIKTDDIDYIYKPTTDNTVNIIDITSLISRGHTVIIEIPKYNFVDVYDLTTHCAACNVFDRSIIKNIYDLNIVNKKYSSNKELVLSLYDRDYSWIYSLDENIKVVKYNKNENTFNPDAGEILIENVGRDVHTFFAHIIKNYDNLPDYMFTSQDYPFDHISNYVEIINGNPSIWDKYAAFNDDECWIFNNQFGGFKDLVQSDANGAPWHPVPIPVSGIWQELFVNDFPGMIFFPAAGHFCVSKKQVHKRSKAFYEKIVNILETDPMSPWAIERIEHYILAGVEKSKL